MNIALTNLWALTGLSAIVVLFVIYLFKAKFKTRYVSSLMLWAEESKPTEGGKKTQPTRIPPIFFLEALILAIIVLAAANPYLLVQNSKYTYSIVLDDSFSMLAGEKISFRDSAIEFLSKESKNWKFSKIRLILAGSRPLILSDDALSTDRMIDILQKEWKCNSTTSNAPDSLALARELGGNNNRIIFLTDHPPLTEPSDGLTRWYSSGKSLPNLSFSEAIRSNIDGTEKVMLEISNFSSEVVQTELGITIGEKTEKSAISIKPHQKFPFKYEFSETDSSASFSARIGLDSLIFDNQINLLKYSRNPLPTDVVIKNEELKDRIIAALEATGRTIPVKIKPALVFSDEIPSENSKAVEPETNCWRVIFSSPADSKPYLGPFLFDKSHPITDGLSLADCIWGADEKFAPRGTPVIFVGNTPLLSIYGNQINIQLCHEKSNIFNSADWPILISNIIDYRNSFSPGPEKSNFFLGNNVRIILPGENKEAMIIRPDGSITKLDKTDILTAYHANSPGIHLFRTDRESWNFSVNTVSLEESDLSLCQPGTWGFWHEGYEGTDKFSLLAILAVIALLLSMFHGYYLSRITSSAGELT
ncbi:MAG: BatA and WFA domain-containing protein [Candidatus Riflebacteria bacterium]|nr:BatA and WFA domain-containing protein [Candidatus Riflebacteria bacterium]